MNSAGFFSCEWLQKAEIKDGSPQSNNEDDSDPFSDD